MKNEGEQSRHMTFDEIQAAKPEGLKRLEHIHYGSFQGGAERFQGNPSVMGRAIGDFVAKILGDETITRGDLVRFIADNGVYNSIMSSYTGGGPVDE